MAGGELWTGGGARLAVGRRQAIKTYREHPDRPGGAGGDLRGDLVGVGVHIENLTGAFFILSS